ncbi:aminotransferase class IV [Amycolatopsis sp. NBC_00355]|uniref:aminotransferase class IV n=1 Tax=Amycolatopsis sp. NBC_00355 TaxID=2975957 RepID=UPI002E273509
MTSTWRWDDEHARLTPTAQAAEVRVIDSFLVEDGRARGLAEHRERFRFACRDHGGRAAGDLGRFFDAVVRTVPVPGRWFPRVELVMGGARPEFRLLVRQAPERTAAVRLWVCPEPDRRREPTVKGADLAWLGEIRAAAVTAGADEAAVVSASGQLVEGSTTSVVWWRSGTLCLPASRAVLPSVTRRLLVAAAVATGTPVSEEAAVPEDLVDVPVWTLNALHGVRPVTGWAGLTDDPPVKQPGRWQSYLDDLAVPLIERSGTDAHRVHH